MPARLSTLLLAAGLPLAVQSQMDADTFLQSCERHEEVTQAERQSTASACLAFLQGYVAASGKFATVSEKPSPFMQRALRNRAPKQQYVDDILNARYCLQEDFSFDMLIARVVQYSAQPPDAETPSDLVEAVLDAEFRC